MRSVKRLIKERADPVIQDSVVLCGDVAPLRVLRKDLSINAIGRVFLRCSEEREQIFTLCRRASVRLVVARQAFLEGLLGSDLTRLTNYGKGCHLLAVADGDVVDPVSALRMLRLGCRGVLPRRSPPKIFRKAVSAVLKGEFWAPRVVVSELLSDLLRAATLTNENGLTPQEARILELSSQGYKNYSIAEVLCISPETVRWHKRRLNRKLAESQALRYNLATGNDPGTEASETGLAYSSNRHPLSLPPKPSRRASPLPKQPVQNV